MNVDKLTREERSYLLGLFLTDGSMFRRGKRHCDVHLWLQRNEMELANRVATMLKSADLVPHIYEYSRKKRFVALAVSSNNLDSFFPDKKILLCDDKVMQKFFDENALSTIQCGVPFIAGLLDGDGYCRASLDGRWFRSIRLWGWELSQYRLVFLVHYLKRSVELIAPDSVTIKTYASGRVRASIRKDGIVALMSKGIADYSFKVARWLEARLRLENVRTKYYSTREIGEILGLCRTTVRHLLSTGKMKYYRKCRSYYVSADELKIREVSATSMNTGARSPCPSDGDEIKYGLISQQ
jgi:hypothetical protein